MQILRSFHSLVGTCGALRCSWLLAIFTQSNIYAWSTLNSLSGEKKLNLGAYNGTTANNALREDLGNRPLVYMWGAGKGWISQGCEFSSAPWAGDWIYRVCLHAEVYRWRRGRRSWVYNWRRDVEVEFVFAELCLMRDWRQVASGMQSLSLDQLFSMLSNKTLCIPNNSLKCSKLSCSVLEQKRGGDTFLQFGFKSSQIFGSTRLYAKMASIGFSLFNYSITL